MLSSQQIKNLITNVFAFVLLFGTFAAVHSMSMDQPVQAEGRLSQYYGPGTTGGGGVVYPGDMYPGDNLPIYPGDEKWEGLYNPVYAGSGAGALSTDGTSLYGATDAASYQGDSPIVVGRWVNDTWQRIAPGENGYLNGDVSTTAYNNGRLYIGGSLKKVGPVYTKGIAYWDGTQWSNMGSNLRTPYGNGHVDSIAFSGNNLFAGGYFQYLGDVPANFVTRWDGSQWYPLGDGVSGQVTAIATQGSSLFVSGYFSMAGGQPANHIARWDGSQWYPLGEGLDGVASVITVSGNDVYVGGSFQYAGDQPANNIARWDGSQWHPLGNGLNRWVFDIKVTPEGIYAGGPFEAQVGGTSSYGVALWNGKIWTNLGSGFNTAATSIQPLGSKVFFAGGFSVAGNNLSNGLAAWNLKPEAAAFRLGDQPVAPGSSITLFARFFPANTPVDFYINQLRQASVNSTSQVEPGLLAAQTILSNADGEVSVLLATEANSPAGDYTFVFAGGGVSSGGKFYLSDDAPLVQTPYAGDELALPDVPDLPNRQYLPMLAR